MSKPREVTVRVRVTVSERAAWRRAAKVKEGSEGNLSRYIRTTLNAQAVLDATVAEVKENTSAEAKA